MEIKTGQKAPGFSLPDQDNKNHKLSDYQGRFVLLYFYPKDNTPGCTKEACTMQESLTAFKEIKAQVFGISADSVASHKKFSNKFNLTFPLLSDPDKEVINKYGTWGEKSMFGRTFSGIKRTSFLIDPQGKIVKIYQNVKPAEHAEEVLQDIKTTRDKKQGLSIKE